MSIESRSTIRAITDLYSVQHDVSMQIWYISPRLPGKPGTMDAKLVGDIGNLAQMIWLELAGGMYGNAQKISRSVRRSFLLGSMNSFTDLMSRALST